MGFDVTGPSAIVLFSESFVDATCYFEDDDLPPPNQHLAKRYAAMTDAQLIAEIWAMTKAGALQ